MLGLGCWAGVSLVTASRGSSSPWCAAFSLRSSARGCRLSAPRPQITVVAHGPSCSEGSSRIRGRSLIVLHWQEVFTPALAVEPRELISNELLNVRTPGRPCAWLAGWELAGRGPPRPVQLLVLRPQLRLPGRAHHLLPVPRPSPPLSRVILPC